MSIDAAAELLGVTPTRIYQLLKAGELEKFKVGGAVLHPDTQPHQIHRETR